MAAKSRTVFECQTCGARHSRWVGKCESCGSWNSIQEVRDEASGAPAGLTLGAGGIRLAFSGLDGKMSDYPRATTGIRELDRVLGGGLVAGGVILVGGDPGIGKSTILLQAAANVAKAGKVFYLTGEESVGQVRMRAARLGLSDAPVLLAANSNVRDIAATLAAEPSVAAVVIDSIQTMFLDTVLSAPGTITQVRTSAGELIRLAKQKSFALFLIGHVTKEGALAGPRVLEHMVDTVLYFEGERGHQFRILRSVKNRYGATDEIGVFEMTDRGLAEVENPSALFLAERRGNVAGSSVFAGMEGTRPLLLEIQALVSPSNGGGARRSSVGYDGARLSMITAVLDARCGQEFCGCDIFLNVAGGLKIGEPAGDLAVAAALLSSKNNIPAPSDMAIFGEIGLSGEVRAVSHMDLRIKEAAKLGFKRAMVPKSGKLKAATDMKIAQVGHLQDLAAMFKK
ncbi:MAG: DNA repair protein RadA [Rickettsiales bacterium]|jgi:DNA repair protein RadA/Sms|nr:DNA repair protein RadA [Rickettsiales bacterium]